MTTGRGRISEDEIWDLASQIDDAYCDRTVLSLITDDLQYTTKNLFTAVGEAIRAGALDDILYNRGVDFDEYDD